MTDILNILGISLVFAFLLVQLISAFPDQFSWVFRGKLISPEEMISYNNCMDVADMEADEATKGLETELTRYMTMYDELKTQYDHVLTDNVNLTTELETAQNLNTVFNERLKQLLDNLRAETITTAFMRKTKANIRHHFIQKLNSIQKHIASLN